MAGCAHAIGVGRALRKSPLYGAPSLTHRAAHSSRPRGVETRLCKIPLLKRTHCQFSSGARFKVLLPLQNRSCQAPCPLVGATSSLCLPSPESDDCLLGLYLSAHGSPSAGFFFSVCLPGECLLPLPHWAPASPPWAQRGFSGPRRAPPSKPMAPESSPSRPLALRSSGAGSATFVLAPRGFSLMEERTTVFRPPLIEGLPCAKIYAHIPFRLLL